MCNIDHKINKISSRQTDNIKALSKRLGSLKITNKAPSEMNERSDKIMSVALVLAMINDNI